MGLIEPTGEKNLSRRTFIVTGLSATGGLMLGVAMPGLASAAMLPEAPWSNDAHAANEINAWIVIDPDETITIRIPHSEMGQGAGTANPMLVAEELECDWSKVKGEFASPNRNVRENNVYKDQNTVGSRGVATSWQYLQQAGASARVRLVQAAANRWNVPASECVAENGAVLHKASSRSLTYGKLAADAAKIALDKEPAIKSFDQLKLLGKPLPRLDTPVKVDGRAKFGIDTKRPGMVYAAIISCPVVGGTLASVDESGLAGKRGILKVVKLKDAVAVVADNTWRAQQGVDALKVTWNYGPAGSVDTAQMKKMYRDTLNDPMVQVRNDGDAVGSAVQRRQDHRSDVRRAASRARADGALERDRRNHSGSSGRLGWERNTRSTRCSLAPRPPDSSPNRSSFIIPISAAGSAGVEPMTKWCRPSPLPRKSASR